MPKVKPEVVNTNFKVIRLNLLEMETKSTIPMANILFTWPFTWSKCPLQWKGYQPETVLQHEYINNNR